MSKIAVLVATLAVVAAVPGMASAKSGGLTTSSRAPSGVQAKPERPAVQFTKMKLIKCHTYMRGHGPVTVCF